ncbi:immunity 49 family protein [Nocardiopsis sp. NPDC049922]|uniref:immunity 49 family protein n=1 Tax=Nocardiopsis sp. NPDC049922 TaxID=3155157 RepID=UPI0033DDA877
MTTIVSRHDVTSPVYAAHAERFPAERSRQVARLEKTAKSAPSVLSSIYVDARISLVLDPEAVQLQTWQAWVVSMQVAHALFAVSTASKGTDVECVIDQKPRHLTATGPRYYTNASNWTQAFFLAVTCREDRRWRELCQIPVDLLREAGQSKGTRYNPYTYHWVAALQAFMTNRPGLVDELTAAMEMSDPRQVEFGDPEALNKLVFPQMEAFLKFAQGDPAGFNESLANGLRLFRDYHTTNEERAQNIDGTVPLGLLALACMAYDRSFHEPAFRLEVESDYLPKHIVERSWYGEFPT